jgi:hypothetical protein
MSANYAHLAANATVNVAKNPCTLYSVTINTKGAASNTLTLYDNASAGSGTIIAVIDTTAGPSSYQFGATGIQLGNGLTAVMATGTTADVTIAFG